MAAWIVKREAADNGTLWEVFVYDYNLHVSGHFEDEIRVKPSELADALNSDMWECEGYEKVSVQVNLDNREYDAHIYPCRQKTRYAQALDLKKHADEVLHELKEQKQFEQDKEAW